MELLSFLKGTLRHKIAILIILSFSVVALATIIPDNTTIVGDLTLQGTNGIDVNPGSDTNADLLTVGVTGSPGLKWNESEDAFRFIKSLLIGTSASRTSTVNASSIVSNLSIKDESGTDPKGILIEKHSASDAVGGNIMIGRSRGSIASPTSVADTDLISRIVGLGYDGTDYAPAGDISILISGTPSGSSMPGAIVFRTTPSGSTTPSEAMRIVPHGGLGLKSTTVDASSVLDLGGVTRGSRPAPLMSQTQRNAIISPANALMVFNNDYLTYDFYNGSTWEKFSTDTNTLTLTNKTLTSPALTTPSIDVATLDGQGSTPSTPSSGYYKAYVKDSTGKLTILNSAGTETAVGGGAGGINLVGDAGDAEAGTTGWATFADAASSRPVNGVDGSPTVTWTTSSSSPLYGSNSFVFTKDAANRQGEGVSYSFTVSPAHQAKVLQISMDYIVGSGTFVAGTNTTDSDVIAYLYDVTNSQLIEPSSFKFLSNSTTIADRFNATFQTSATGTSYRLILYCASTSSSAYTVKFDNISVSPSTYVYGTPITDWQSYTPTFTGFGTVTSPEVFWRRTGEDVEIEGKFIAGTTTAVEARVSLPAGLTSASTTKIPTIRLAGDAARNDGTAPASVYRTLIEPSSTYITFGQESATLLTKINGTNFPNGYYIPFRAKFPILGWSSSVQMSEQTDTRVVAAKLGGGTTSITSSPTIVGFTSAINDTNGTATTGASAKWTATSPGFYWVSSFVQFNSNTIGSGGIQTLALYKNGSYFDYLDRQSWSSVTVQLALSGSTQVYLNAGDYIDIRATNNTTTSLDGNCYMNVMRVSGPSAIAASESVNARYTTTAGQSVSNASLTIIDFGTKAFDSHNAVTTGASWKFTAPISGKYRVSANLTTTSTGNFSAAEYIETRVYKGGSLYAAKIHSDYNGSTSNKSVQITTIVDLLAGEYIDVREYQTSGGAMPLESAAGYNWIDVERVGN